MVVLDSNGTVVSAASQSAPHQYHHLQYVQPLPSDVSLKKSFYRDPAKSPGTFFCGCRLISSRSIGKYTLF
jgi:hypothetical protein